ncbi:MAG: signal peptide peptidase SppA [Caldithrix sp.]|nr:signal peptide peptidase SppA [Caldithrix sp.]
MKTFFKWLAGVFTALILFVLVIFLIIMAIIDTEPEIRDNSYVAIQLSGSLPEYIPPDPLSDALTPPPMDLKKVRDVLEKASVDDRINGVVLEIGFLQTGFGTLQELTHLIQHFKESGKPIYAYLDTEITFTADYYVASACDSVFMPPSSNLFITGVSSEVTFYKDFFKKIGVEAEFLHVGQYKNAPDTYTRSDMSDAHRLVLNNLLDQYYTEILATIAENRGIQYKTVEKIVNKQAGMTGNEASLNGLVDANLFLSDIEDKLKSKNRHPHRLSASDYAIIPASSLKIRNKSRIDVIHVSGMIASGSNSDDPVLGQMAGSGSIVNYLERSAQSSVTKAIVLRIDSPGGSAGASEQIWEAIRKAAKKKPVIASISDYGASGAYYIAMAADSIIATKSSLVGSIGIFAGKFNISGLYEKLGLHSEAIKRGRHADIFSLKKSWTREDKKIIKNLITDFYKDFVAKVADSRQLSFEEAEALAQGRVWTGAEAEGNDLIDAHGFFYTAVEAAKQKAGITDDTSVRLVYYPREKSLFSSMFKAAQAQITLINDIKTLNVERVEKSIHRLQNKPMALLPFQLDWQ